MATIPADVWKETLKQSVRMLYLHGCSRHLLQSHSYSSQYIYFSSSFIFFLAFQAQSVSQFPPTALR
jgi:hypothetical protein